jgi:hypothetical protein
MANPVPKPFGKDCAMSGLPHIPSKRYAKWEYCRVVYNEVRLTVLLDGKTAKEIFDSIGPDYPETCSDAKGDRHRRKKGIVCFYTAEDEKDKDGPYRCWIGMDLRTGDTVGTISC